MKVAKIVLTGGPCGGKTTSIQRIVDEFSEKGYKVIVVPEAASILISSGINPFGKDSIDLVEFQRYNIRLQLQLESFAEKVANDSDKETIIICDRGIMDNKAYITNEEFKLILEEINEKEADIIRRYDLVLHLRTAADGKEEFYTLANNSSRTETAEEARQRDVRTLESWLGHPRLKIIGNETGFDEKLQSVINQIYDLLKKPYSIHKQGKYLVDNIDIDSLLKTQFIKFNIEQYITSSDNKDIIYRKSDKDGENQYNIITKIDTNINGERITTQKAISEREYYDSIPKKMKPIEKTRYCFAYKNSYFKLDVFNDGLKILKIEGENQIKDVPPFIEICDDITDNHDYRNSNIFNKLNEKVKIKKKPSN